MARLRDIPSALVLVFSSFITVGSKLRIRFENHVLVSLTFISLVPRLIPEQWVPFHPLWQGDQFGSGVGDVSCDKEKLVELGGDQATLIVELLKR